MPRPNHAPAPPAASDEAPRFMAFKNQVVALDPDAAEVASEMNARLAATLTRKGGAQTVAAAMNAYADIVLRGPPASDAKRKRSRRTL